MPEHKAPQQWQQSGWQKTAQQSASKQYCQKSIHNLKKKEKMVEVSTDVIMETGLSLKKRD